MTGTIKKLITDKGFGFISSAELPPGKDLFFHSSAVAGTTFDQLQEGMSVTFESEQGPKGLNAKNVQVAAV